MKILLLTSLLILGSQSTYLIGPPQSFEAIINEEFHELKYQEGKINKYPLSNPTDITHARLQNVQGDIDLLKCLFWANRADNYLSPIFNQHAPLLELEASFPAAERMLCYAWSTYPESMRVFIFMQSEQQQQQQQQQQNGQSLFIRSAGAFDGMSGWYNDFPERRFSKIKIIDSPKAKAETVCEIRLRNEQVIRIRYGEEWASDTPIDVLRIDCDIIDDDEDEDEA